jgi:hypothetical protein
MKTSHVIQLVVATAALYVLPAVKAGAQCAPLNCSDTVPDTCAIQSLLNGGGTIALPADGCSQGYIIDGTLHLNQPGTTLTSSSASGNRALLLAATGLNVLMMKVDPGVSNYTISNIFFYGNRFNRTSPNCAGDHTSANLWLDGSGWTLDNIESDAAPCQTSTVVVLTSSNFEIRNSWFANNGSTSSLSDGLTVHACFGGWIHNNNFVDNTDVDLIVGGGNCTVQDNTVQHTQGFGEAGIMLGKFAGGDGNHAGSTYSGNNISSGLDKLGIGIMVGHHPWTALNTLADAGSVLNNTASGAVINLAVEGITGGGGGTVSGNTVSGAQRQNAGLFACPVSNNYTVFHTGSASLQGTPAPLQLQFDTGVCTQH